MPTLLLIVMILRTMALGVMGALADSRLKLRVEVLRHQDDLDRALAAGTPPTASFQHELRALQLQSRHKRHELAHAVHSILHRAQHPPHWHSAALPVQAEAVQDARAELEQLRSILLGPEELSPKGLALASLLLHGSDSPICCDDPDCTVATQARAALIAIHSNTSIESAG